MYGPRHTLGCSLVLYTLILGTSQSSNHRPDDAQVTCEKANKNCTARVGCGMALHNFLLGCNKVINGESDNCTGQCTRALISLFSTEDDIGQSLVACDCQGDSYCRAIETRVNVCATSVLEAMKTLKDTKRVVSCSLARWLCEADAQCQTAFTYYLARCERLYGGQECTQSCKDSLTILYRQPKAAKLNNCACEDNECAMFQKNTQKLCFNTDSIYSVNNMLHARSTSSHSRQVTWQMIRVLLVLSLIY